MRTMYLLQDPLRDGHPDHGGFLIADLTGRPADHTTQMDFGRTIVHELGHVLGLKHRYVRKKKGDGLAHPPEGQKNIMCAFDGVYDDRFDLLQAHAASFSVVVRNWSKEA